MSIDNLNHDATQQDDGSMSAVVARLAAEVVNSYFATCPRNPRGHCLPKGSVGATRAAKAATKPQTKSGSYFKTCPRNAKGHCLPKTAAGAGAGAGAAVAPPPPPEEPAAVAPPPETPKTDDLPPWMRSTVAYKDVSERLDKASTWDVTERTMEMRKIMDERSVPHDPLRAHGMENVEDMSTMTIGGTQWLWAHGVDRGNVARSMVAALDKEVHPAMYAANDRVIFTAQRNSEDPHWAAVYNRPGFTSAATGGDGSVVVYNGKTMSTGTFAHESGHNIANIMWKNVSPPETSSFARASIKEPRAVSEYGRNNIAEDFAETARLTADRVERANLRAFFPEKYASVTAIMNLQQVMYNRRAAEHAKVPKITPEGL